MGIPIDNNTKFQSCGSTYMLQVSLYCNANDNMLRISLDTANIQEFEYSNALNKLYVEGSVTYLDCNGSIDKFLHKQYTYCDVEFFKFADEGEDYASLQPLKDQSFLHKFFVKSISILNRVGNDIVYKVMMVSTNWFSSMATLTYSNYGQKPETILEIIKKVLVLNGLRVDDKSFNQAKTDVRLNYITNGNQNVETAIKYLLTRQFYDRKQLDQSIKFLVYNDIKDRFGIFDLVDHASVQYVEQILVQMFGTQLEQFSSSAAMNFGTIVQYSNADLFYAMYDKNVFDYDFQHDKFLMVEAKNEVPVDIYNQNLNLTGYKPKFEKRFLSTKSYLTRTAYWNNSALEKNYLDMVNTMMNNNAFVLNTNGVIARKPSGVMLVNVDRAKTVSLENQDDINKRYKAYEGHWLITKVFNIIHPRAADSEKYKQNIVLARNFVLNDIPKNLTF